MRERGEPGRRPAYGQWATLVGVWLVGVLLRAYGLGKQGLFLDEAFSWAVGRLPVSEVLRLSLRDPHPPLYYLLLQPVVTLFPTSAVALRLPGLLFAAATLLLLLVLAARLGGRRAALYAGLLLGLSSFDIYHTQDARMYPLLTLEWLLAYGLLLQAWQRGGRFWLAWGTVLIALGWTHFYGLLAVGAQLLFLAVAWAWARVQRRAPPFHEGGLALVLGAVALALAPIFWFFWIHHESGANGTWVPTLQDLPAFAGLTTVGLMAVRDRFLDGGHLVLPALEGVPLRLWWLLGTGALSLAVMGLIGGWQSGGEERRAALLAATMICLPLVVAWGYGWLGQRPTWALRPLLGVTSLLYLWMGIGLSRLGAAWLRAAVVSALVAVALLSLIPYFTSWQKSDSVGLGTIPASGGAAVLIEFPYVAPVALFYVGDDLPVLSLRDGALVSITPATSIYGRSSPLACESATMARVTDIYLHGVVERMRLQSAAWPACLRESNLWYFDRERWVPLIVPP